MLCGHPKYDAQIQITGLTIATNGSDRGFQIPNFVSVEYQRHLERLGILLRCSHSHVHLWSNPLPRVYQMYLRPNSSVHTHSLSLSFPTLTRAQIHSHTCACGGTYGLVKKRQDFYLCKWPCDCDQP